MAKKKIKYPPSAIRKADKEIKKLMQDIIEKKMGGTTTKKKTTPKRTLNKVSGNLHRNVKPVIRAKSNGELFIDVEVMEYYQYLDEGTKRIKNPWFLTEELMNKSEFLDAITDLTREGFEETIIEVFSKLPKKIG